MSNKKEIREDIAQFNALDAVKHSEGGKFIIKKSLESIVATMELLASSYTTLSHAELVTLCARLSERLAVYRLLNNTETNIKFAEEALEEALKEDPDN
jgi:hypothetical protein